MSHNNKGSIIPVNVSEILASATMKNAKQDLCFEGFPWWLNYDLRYISKGIDRGYAYTTNYYNTTWWKFDWEPVINYIESLSLVRMHLGVDTHHGKRENPWSNK